MKKITFTVMLLAYFTTVTAQEINKYLYHGQGMSFILTGYLQFERPGRGRKLTDIEIIPDPDTEILIIPDTLHLAPHDDNLNFYEWIPINKLYIKYFSRSKNLKKISLPGGAYFIDNGYIPYSLSNVDEIQIRSVRETSINIYNEKELVYYRQSGTYPSGINSHRCTLRVPEDNLEYFESVTPWNYFNNIKPFKPEEQSYFPKEKFVIMEAPVLPKVGENFLPDSGLSNLVENVVEVREKNIVGSYNTSGIQTNDIPEGQVQILRYSDGTAEKRTK